MGKNQFRRHPQGSLPAYVPEAKVRRLRHRPRRLRPQPGGRRRAHKVFEYLKEMEELAELGDGKRPMNFPTDERSQRIQQVIFSNPLAHFIRWRNKSEMKSSRRISRWRTRAAIGAGNFTASRPGRGTSWKFCGGQTHAIVKFGIDELLPKQITLIHDRASGLRDAAGK